VWCRQYADGRRRLACQPYWLASTASLVHPKRFPDPAATHIENHWRGRGVGRQYPQPVLPP
jgi:hypothetical protein